MRTHEHPVEGGRLRLDASKVLRERAVRVIPGQTNTISKRVSAFGSPDAFPAYAARAEGATLYDVDGNAYIDYVAALAPIILGYNDARVNDKVRAQLARGVLFSLPSGQEVELSELLTQVVPGAESVRLMKSGAEATSAAVRTARLYTSRDRVLCCGYHGWHDWWVATQSSHGVPRAVAELTHAFAFGDLTAARALVAQHGRGVACIIVTPALYGQHPPEGFLSGLRALADEIGAVLIFDEIITGFRWALGGAQQRYAVSPDLAVFGKAMANGLPVAALTGRRALMEALGNNWVSSTFASEALSLAAAMETITILRDTDALEVVQRRADRIHAAMAGIAQAAAVRIRRFDALPALRFEFDVPGVSRGALNDAFITECARRGVLIRRDGECFSLCLMAALSERQVERTLEVFGDALNAARVQTEALT